MEAVYTRAVLFLLFLQVLRWWYNVLAEQGWISREKSNLLRIRFERGYFIAKIPMEHGTSQRVPAESRSIIVDEIKLLSHSAIMLSLFSNPRLFPVVIAVRTALFPSLSAHTYLLSSPSRIDPDHELGVCLRHNPDVSLNQESVIELPRRLRLTMLDVSNFAINSYLHSRILALMLACVSDPILERLCHERWVSVSRRCCKVKHAAYRDGVLKCTGVKIQKRRTRVGESGRAAERELEGLFEQKPTEDHEVVAIAVLWLHYLRAVQTGFVHVDDIFGLAYG